jgi:hypothetical protein
MKRWISLNTVVALALGTALVGGAIGCSSDDDDHHNRRGRTVDSSDNLRDRDRDGIRDGLEDRNRDGVRDGMENGGRNPRRNPDLYR